MCLWIGEQVEKSGTAGKGKLIIAKFMFEEKLGYNLFA
jgi:hypothetical protein